MVAEAGNPRINAMLPRPGERHSFGRNLAFLERFLVLDSHDEIAGPLRLRGRGDDQPGIVFELLSPRTEVGRRVLEPDRVQNARLVRQERRAEFGNQFLFRIPLGTKSRVLRDTLPVQAGDVARCVDHLMVKGVVIVLPAVEDGGRRDADHVILG